jgi:hypothetical protein
MATMGHDHCFSCLSDLIMKHRKIYVLSYIERVREVIAKSGQSGGCGSAAPWVRQCRTLNLLKVRPSCQLCGGHLKIFFPSQAHATPSLSLLSQHATPPLSSSPVRARRRPCCAARLPPSGSAAPAAAPPPRELVAACSPWPGCPLPSPLHSTWLQGKTLI